MNKKGFISYITSRWFAEKIYDDVIFYKHLCTSKRSSIYQIILSGTMYDGIYELNVGDKFTWDMDENENVTIKSVNSLDCALFRGQNGFPEGYMNPAKCGKYGYSIVRVDYQNEESFREALLATGFVTEDEYYTYTFRESQAYIYSKLPKIGFIA